MGNIGKMVKKVVVPVDPPPLDRHRVDEILDGSRPEMLWGLPAIARALNVSEATARRWAADAAVPIYQPAGARTHFACRSELMAWLRNRAA